MEIEYDDDPRRVQRDVVRRWLTTEVYLRRPAPLDLGLGVLLWRTRLFRVPPPPLREPTLDG